MVFAEDVGTEVFAGDCTVCPLFNDDGALRRKSAAPLSNLTQKLRVKSKRFGHTREAAMVENIGPEVHDCNYIACRYMFVNSISLVETDIARGYIVGMKDIETIRKENATLLLGKGGLIRQAELARRMHISPAQVQQWKAGYRIPESESCRKIEKAAELPVGWMDQDHSAIGGEFTILGGALALPVPTESPETSPIPHSIWATIPPAARALIETVVTKSSDGELDDGDLALLLSTVSRLSSKE